MKFKIFLKVAVVLIILVGITFPVSANKNIQSYCKEGDRLLKLYETDGIRSPNSKYHAAYTEAEENYKKALSLDSNCAEAYYGLGNVYRAKMNYLLGIQDTPFAKWFLSPADVERIKEAIPNHQSEAISYYQKAKDIDPQNAKYYIACGDLYVTAKMYPFAIDEYSKAIDIDSNDFYLFIIRGKLYRQSKNYSQAADDFNRALDILKNTNIQQYYREVREVDSEEPRLINYRKTTNLYYFALSYDELGLVYMDLNDYNGALNNFEETLKLVVDDNYSYHIGLAYEKLANYKKSLEIYNKLLEKQPKNKIFKQAKKRVEKAVKSQSKLPKSK